MISILGLVIWRVSYNLLSNVIIKSINLLLDKKSMIDIWNRLLVCVFYVLCEISILKKNIYSASINSFHFLVIVVN